MRSLDSGFGIDSFSDVLRRNRPRWFGHVKRKNDDDWVKACHRLEVPGGRVGAGVRNRGENVLQRT